MSIAITLGKSALRGIYSLYKLSAVKPKKVVFLSRQDDKPGVDFLLLEKELKRMDPEIETKMLCKTLDGGLGKKIGYLLNLIGPQMRNLATAKVAVLDSYSIGVSLLNHRPDLKVIQIWHAMGALKKFSKSIIGKREGRSPELAKSMGMHKNYDVILASSDESRDAFSEAFGYEKDRFIIGALPRADLLKDDDFKEKMRELFFKKHPDLKDKKIILYAPTLRRTDEDINRTKELADEINKMEGYALLVSPHPVKREPYLGLTDILITEFSTFDLLPVCDYFITDYSAVVYEAALLEKPIFLYAYDLDDYLENRGFYLDYERDMPNRPVKSSKEVAKMISGNDFDPNRIRAFGERYIKLHENNTGMVANKILELMNA